MDSNNAKLRVEVIQLLSKVLTHLSGVKDSSNDRTNCVTEVSNMPSLLPNLRYRLEEGSTDMPHYATVRVLAVGNQQLDQVKQILEILEAEIANLALTEAAGGARVWKINKGDLTRLVHRIEHLKPRK